MQNLGLRLLKAPQDIQETLRRTRPHLACYRIILRVTRQDVLILEAYQHSRTREERGTGRPEHSLRKGSLLNSNVTSWYNNRNVSNRGSSVFNQFSLGSNYWLNFFPWRIEGNSFSVFTLLLSILTQINLSSSDLRCGRLSNIEVFRALLMEALAKVPEMG